VLQGRRNPGKRFFNGVARAFGDVTVEEVMRRAGVLLSLPETKGDSILSDLLDLAKNMSLEDQRHLLEYARWRHQKGHG
jgi:hypothetical protein